MTARIKHGKARRRTVEEQKTLDGVIQHRAIMGFNVQAYRWRRVWDGEAFVNASRPGPSIPRFELVTRRSDGETLEVGQRVDARRLATARRRAKNRVARATRRNARRRG